MTILTFLSLVSYCICSLNLSVLLSNKIYHKDIRAIGSKNPGTANTLRNFGIIPALFVLCFDVFKAYFCLKFAQHLLTEIYGYPEVLCLPVSMSIIIGHNYSVFLHFNGGKGVAVSLGILLAMSPYCALILIFIALIAAVSSESVSVSSIISAMFSIPVLGLYAFTNAQNLLYYSLTGVLILVFIYLRHAQSIKRFKSGT